MKTDREQILEKLQSVNRFEWEYPESNEFERDTGFDAPEPLPEVFIKRLEAVGGKGYTIGTPLEFADSISRLANVRNWRIIYCPYNDLGKFLQASNVNCIKKEPESGNYDVAITRCESLIALTGSVLAASSHTGRKVYTAPDVHVVYAGVSQLKPCIKDGFGAIQGRPSWMGLITGPSRTADIEKTLVMGAHGPKELIVFIDKSC
ncbi:MAG: LUD domain-containing protein [Cytophagaceae bacterium]|jgi:L-lactate dehydrogenase complex protein LldG|nr:LUD domain-containing protein [Cytophagaceae bacterium]